LKSSCTPDFWKLFARLLNKSPLLLHYVSEIGTVESATLAVYINTDIPEEKAKDILSQFDKEWQGSISKEAKKLLMVDMI